MRRLTLTCILLAQLPLVARADWKAETTPQTGWEYSQRPDEMGRGTKYRAVLHSVNRIEFSSPYDGEQPGLLVLEGFPVVVGSTTETSHLVMLLVVRAQFASTYSHANV